MVALDYATAPQLLVPAVEHTAGVGTAAVGIAGVDTMVESFVEVDSLGLLVGGSFVVADPS